MMYWYGNGWGWGWGLVTLAFWVLVVVAVVLLVRHFTRGGQQPPSGPTHYGPPAGSRSSAEQLLAERYARGEIDDDEYRRRLATLRGEATTGSGSGPAGGQAPR